MYCYDLGENSVFFQRNLFVFYWSHWCTSMTSCSWGRSRMRVDIRVGGCVLCCPLDTLARSLYAWVLCDNPVQRVGDGLGVVRSCVALRVVVVMLCVHRHGSRFALDALAIASRGPTC